MEKEDILQDSHCCIAKIMYEMLMEQKQLSGEGFQYVKNPFGIDTIPFMLHSKDECEKPYKAHVLKKKTLECVSSSFFRVEDVDVENCCAVVSILKPIDMCGYFVEDWEELYTLIRTNACHKIDLNCFCAITPLPPQIVNRPLPIIEPKC